MVEEISLRIPYFEALCCLRDADALIVLGSDDSGYTASKIFPYILANRPLLAIFHEDSSVVNLIRSTNSGRVVTFNGATDVELVSAEIEAHWRHSGSEPEVQTKWSAFDSYTARQMTRKLCGIFDGVAVSG